MTTPPPAFQPDELFEGTAAYYARYRPSYPDELFDALRERFSLDGSQRVLDLGCGTGQLAIPLAPLVREVVAVDPDAAMIEEARRAAAARSVENVDWRVGDSYRLAELGADPIYLTTMGSSFHWMDRDATLSQLDAMTAPGGGVVVASNGPREPPPWEEVVKEVRVELLGSERRAGSGTYSHPAERHEVILARSAFSDVESLSFEWSLERDVESVIGLQLSFSFSSPAQLGDRKQTFEDELRRRLTELAPAGRLVEQIVTEALVARRSSGN